MDFWLSLVKYFTLLVYKSIKRTDLTICGVEQLGEEGVEVATNYYATSQQVNINDVDLTAVLWANSKMSIKEKVLR